VRKATTPLANLPRHPGPSGSPLRERLTTMGLSGDVEQDSGRLAAAGLTDGLLVHPPTTRSVDTYLEAAAIGDVRVGPIPLAMAPPSTWDLAACAVMAGCRSDSFPLVLAALEALTAPEFNLPGVQTTTSGVAPLLVVSGAASAGTTGPAPDSLAVGRAVRLALYMLGNALPGVSNLSTQGHPGRISWCVAESPTSPRAPLHADRLPGVDRAMTAVAAVGSVEAVLGQANPEVDLDVLARACAAVRAAGLQRGLSRRQVLILLPPEAAQRLDNAEWDRAKLSSDLMRRADDLLAGRGASPTPHDEPLGPLDSPHGAARPEDVQVVVSGGIGIKAAVIQTWGSGAAVSAPGPLRSSRRPPTGVARAIPRSAQPPGHPLASR
jgi:hypothetical protein